MINEATGDLTAPLSVKGVGDATVQVYRYGQADTSAIAHQPD